MYIMRLFKNYMITQMLLLRFQMCKVVGCCSPPLPPPPEIQNAACRHDHEPHLSTTTSRFHTSAGATTINKHRNAASLERVWYSPPSPPLPQIRNDACRYKLFRRQLRAFTHPLAPPRSLFNSHQNATSQKRYKGNRPNSAQRDCFFQIPEHPMLPQQQPVSSNSASYVLSVSCLFLCGPLRRISVNARFYVQCCLVL